MLIEAPAGSSSGSPARRAVVRAPAIAPEPAATVATGWSLARRQALLLDVLSLLLDAPTVEQGAHAVVDALHVLAGADRVSLSLCEPSGARSFARAPARLVAVSRLATLDASSPESCLLLTAHAEALDQDAVLSYPDSGDSLTVLAAHRALAGRRSGLHMRSIGLFDRGEPVGALLIECRDAERMATFDGGLLEPLAATLAGPLRWRAASERPVAALLASRAMRALRRGVSRERPARLALATVTGAVLAWLAFVPTARSVVATAEIVPLERRLIGAPLDGFIAAMPVRIGDRVEAGDLLVSFDTRDSELERARVASERETAEAASRAAMAAGNRAAMALAHADLARSEARLALAERRTARASLRAPVGGTVIAGDAGQATGRAVSRGDTLLELAPDTALEVHLSIDESDLPLLTDERTGVVALTSAPGGRVPLRIDTIHPVADARDGASRFLARATLLGQAPEVRAGQTGIARLAAGRTTRLAAWTEGLRHAVARGWWRWFG